MNFEQLLGPDFLDVIQPLLEGGSLYVILGLVFIAIVIAVLAVSSLVGSRDPVEHRLATGTTENDVVAPEVRRDKENSLWNNLVSTLEKHGFPIDQTRESSLRLRLYQAGFTNPSAAVVHYVVRVILALGAPLAFLLMVPQFWPDMSAQKIMLYTVFVAVAAIYIPRIWVSMRIDARKRTYLEGFPDALDMLVVCVEAGLSLDSAFTRVGEKIARAHPLMAEEIAMVSLELRAGKTRVDALRNMSRRIGLDEVNSFVSLLIQSDQLGTSVAQSLRVYAEEMRIKRMLRAEEMAHKLPVKLVVPLVTCILPAMICAVLLPAMIRIIRDVLPHLG
ncbi:MAG: type II secretion system F family protein [Pseudomonadota bacterium]